MAEINSIIIDLNGILRRDDTGFEGEISLATSSPLARISITPPPSINKAMTPPCFAMKG